MQAAANRRPTFADFTPDEFQHAQTIVERAAKLYADVGGECDRLSLHMDLAAVHARCPLDLAAFAAADDLNFSHDIGGIARHLDRKTGDLTGCFLPRFARL